MCYSRVPQPYVPWLSILHARERPLISLQNEKVVVSSLLSSLLSILPPWQLPGLTCPPDCVPATNHHPCPYHTPPPLSPPLHGRGIATSVFRGSLNITLEALRALG